jgi:hypothetical protein
VVQEPQPRVPTPAAPVPIAAAETGAEAKAEAEAQGSSPQHAIERKPRSRRFWLLLASAAGAAVVVAIVVAVVYGGGSTEEQARGLLEKADVAIREAAAENLTWHYNAQQTTTMQGDAASGTLTNTMEGDVEPPQRARLSTEVSATGDLTRNLPIMGRVTLANGEEGCAQEALSLDGGNNFYVRGLQDDGDYSEWVETQEKAFVIFAEGWDLSEFVSSFSELLTELEVAGSEEVDGVKCEVIKAKADITKLLEARKELLAGLQNFDLEMLAEFMKDTPPEVKMWIGTDDDLPHRITMKITVSVSEGGMSQSIVMESMESVTRYGETISPPIEAPRTQ